MLNRRHINKTFSLQQEQSDCGVACLQSLIRFYGGDVSLEQLRQLSGTQTSGTTLLGLKQCATNLGMEAEAFEANLSSLKLIEQPCILHVVIAENFLHYVVIYKFDPERNAFLLGDPAKGVSWISLQDLSVIWKGNFLLLVSPGQNFMRSNKTKKDGWAWIFGLVKADLNLLYGTLVLGIFTTILSLSTAIFSQQLIDQILPDKNVFKLSLGLFLLTIVLLIRALTNYVRQQFILLQGKRFNNNLVFSFINKLFFLPKSFFDFRSRGELVARLNDTGVIYKNWSYIVGTFFTDIIIVISTSCFLFFYSFGMAALVYAFIPPLVFLVLRFSKPVNKLQQLSVFANATKERSYLDKLENVLLIKGWVQESNFAAQFIQHFSNFQERNYELGHISNRYTFYTELLSLSLTISLITFSSIKVFSGQLLIGEMMAILSLASSLMPAIVRISQLNFHYQEAEIANARVLEIVKITPEYSPESQCSFTLNQLKAKDIEFGFPGRQALLSSISFNVKIGELIVMLGESGSGKSTFINLLEKFYTPQQGQIEADGLNINNIPTPAWRRCIAIVPQEINFFEGTVLENIAVDNRLELLEEVVPFCKSLGFDRYIDQLPQGYFTRIGTQGISLSGGQRQLIALARALFKKPKLLLLDEVTASMDQFAVSFVYNLLMRLKHQMAILYITHQLPETQLIDHVYFLKKGSFIFSGTLKEYVKKNRGDQLWE